MTGHNNNFKAALFIEIGAYFYFSLACLAKAMAHSHPTLYTRPNTLATRPQTDKRSRHYDNDVALILPKR